MTERWLPVAGHEWGYEVSDAGRVRSIDRIVRRSDGVMRRYRGRILKPSPMAPGAYLIVGLGTGAGRTKTVHRLVATAFCPRPDGADVVRHLDGNKVNNTVANLAWGTTSENRLDDVRLGVHNQSSKTQCPRGHALRSPNLRSDAAARGYRGCLACHRACDNARRNPALDLQATADAIYAALIGVAA